MTLPESTRTAHNPKVPHWDTTSGAPIWAEPHPAECVCEACELYFHPLGREREEAMAHTYDSAVLCFVAQLASGRVVLYDFSRDPIYIGDWEGVAEAYASRPKFVKREPAVSNTGIDLSSLNITL